MPELIRLYIRHIAIGFGLSALFVAGLFYFNIGNLWHLVSTSAQGWIAGFMLWFANGIVFAGVQFAVAVISMGEDDDDDDEGGRMIRLTPERGPVRDLVAIPVPTRAAPRGPHQRR